MTDRPRPGAEIRAAIAVLRALIWVDGRVGALPVVGRIKRRAECIILDTIFGPAEDFDYVSTTAPASPPPTP